MQNDLLKACFKKAEDLLSREPWANIIQFVNHVNETHPDTLTLEITSLDVSMGTMGMNIKSTDTSDFIHFEGFTHVDHNKARAASPSTGIVFLPHEETSLSCTRFSKSKPPSFSISDTPLALIKKELIPDLDVGEFEEPKTNSKLKLTA